MWFPEPEGPLLPVCWGYEMVTNLFERGVDMKKHAVQSPTGAAVMKQGVEQ